MPKLTPHEIPPFHQLVQELALPGRLDELIVEWGLDEANLPGREVAPAQIARAILLQLNPPELQGDAGRAAPRQPNRDEAWDDVALGIQRAVEVYLESPRSLTDWETSQIAGKKHAPRCPITGQPCPRIATLLIGNAGRKRHNLPSPYLDHTKLIGRDKKIETIRQWLSPEEQNRVIVIVGSGGIGKTALAQATAWRYVNGQESLNPEELFSAIIWVSAKISILTPSGQQNSFLDPCLNLSDIYTTIASTLEREDFLRGRLRGRAVDQDEAIRRFLTQRRCLLIVDNLETVSDEKIEGFLRELPFPSKAIVTSRVRQQFGKEIWLESLDEADQLKLISLECRNKGVPISLDDFKRLIPAMGGLPLAIVWTVARLALGHSIEGTVRALTNAGDSLLQFLFTDAMQSPSIKETSALLLLQSLAMFATHAERDALQITADVNEVNAEVGFVNLQKMSLIRRIDNNKYILLPMVKVFVVQAMQPSFIEAARERQVHYFLHRFGPTRTLYNPIHYEDIQRIRDNHTNFLDVLDWCWNNSRHVYVIDIVTILQDYWAYAGLWDLRMHWGLRAIRAADVLGDSKALGFLYVDTVGWVALTRGDTTQANEFVRKGLLLAEKENDLEVQCMAQRYFYRLARTGANRDLQLMSSVNNVSNIPTEGKNLILVAGVQNVLHFRIFDADGKRVLDTDENQLPDKAPQIAELKSLLKDLWGVPQLSQSDNGSVIIAVTSIVGHTPNRDEALRCLTLAQQIAETLNEGFQAGVAIDWATFYETMEGDLKKAEKWTTRSLEGFERMNDSLRVLRKRIDLAWILLKQQKDLSRARELAQVSIDILTSLGVSGTEDNLAFAYHCLGRIAQHDGERECARSHYMQARAIYDELGNSNEASKLGEEIHRLDILPETTERSSASGTASECGACMRSSLHTAQDFVEEEETEQIYQTLWLQAREACSRGELILDRRLCDKDKDFRRGLTLIARPAPHCLDRFCEILQQLRSMMPNQYFYDIKDVHITILTLLDAADEYVISDEHLLKVYHNIVKGLFPVFPPIEVVFRGIGMTPSTIMALGYLVTNTLNRLRDTLRGELRKAGFGNSLDQRYKNCSAHSTLVRFVRPLVNPTHVLDYVEGLRYIDLGTTLVDTVQLVCNDWVMSHDRIRVLETYRLKGV